VAQLDQINAYLLLAAPQLHGRDGERWRRDLRWTVELLIDKYYSEEENRFWGGIHEIAATSWGSRHNDYGHTIKAFWMIREAGELLDEPDWVRFAEKGMRDTLDKALVETWNYDNFLTYCQKLHAAGHPFGNPIGPTSDARDWLGPLFMSFGSVMVDKKGNITVDTAETRQALEYMKKLRFHQEVRRPSDYGLD